MNRTTLLLTVLAILALPVAATSLQRDPNPVGTRIVEGVELTIASQTEACRTGEPVFLHLLLRNCTPKAMDVADAGPDASHIVEVWNDQGRCVDFTELGKQLEKMRRNTTGRALVIPAGETYVDEVELARWFDLSQPGQYTVRVTRRLFPVGSIDPVPLLSNDLTITVLP